MAFVQVFLRQIQETQNNFIMQKLYEDKPSQNYYRFLVVMNLFYMGGRSWKNI